MPKRPTTSGILILSALLALGVAVSSAAGPKYPLVTLEIPPVINDIGAPTAILSSLQETVIAEFRKKNLFAGVLPATEVLDGVLTIQGTALSWDEAGALSETMEVSGGGLLTVRLAIFQKIVTCPFNRAVIKGVVSPEMFKTGSIQPDHALVTGALDFLTLVTGDE